MMIENSESVSGRKSTSRCSPFTHTVPSLRTSISKRLSLIVVMYFIVSRLALHPFVPADPLPVAHVTGGGGHTLRGQLCTAVRHQCRCNRRRFKVRLAWVFL